MRFYNRQHRHYCGIDLHVKTMYVCIRLSLNRCWARTHSGVEACAGNEDGPERDALIRRLFLSVARLLDSTTGRRRSAHLTRGGLIGVRRRGSIVWSIDSERRRARAARWL